MNSKQPGPYETLSQKLKKKNKNYSKLLYQHPRVDAKIGGQQFFKQFPARHLSITEETASAAETDLSPWHREQHIPRCSKAASSLNHEEASNPAGNTLNQHPVKESRSQDTGKTQSHHRLGRN